MLFSFMYLVFVAVLKLLVGSGRSAHVKDVEMIVLRLSASMLCAGRSSVQDCERVTASSSRRQADCSRAGRRHGLLVDAPDRPAVAP